MIEAITAAISNSQLVKQVAEQNSTLQSYSSNPERVQAAAVSAPYLSPHVNLNGGSPIFVIRDSETGEYLRQFPTEGQIKSYQKAGTKAQKQELMQQEVKVDIEPVVNIEDNKEAKEVKLDTQA